MDAVLTVKQPYADRIMEGTKRYEFRRKAPARDIDGLYVHIAGTGPYAQAYVGVNCVHTGTPEAIWEYCSECAAIMPPGISREDFFAYFDGCETATAISLAPRPQVLNPPILLEYLGLKGAPQSIAYAKPQQPEIGDYICPYCGHEQQATYDEWEGSDFEDARPSGVGGSASPSTSTASGSPTTRTSSLTRAPCAPALKARRGSATDGGAASADAPP